MGDRNNPIMFGPEWMRNVARERNAGASTSASNSQSGMGPGPGTAAGGTAAHAAQSSVTGTTMPKVLLANSRYGREEMLALFPLRRQPPPELIYNEMLYQQRGNPPVALNNTFEENLREPSWSGAPRGAMSSGGDRFGVTGRTPTGRDSTATSEGRGRGRLPFIRQQSTSVGRGQSWHANTARMPGYSGGGADNDVNLAQRPRTTNNVSQSNNRNAADQADWQNQNKMFRTKRPGTATNTTNWRQTRDDDEWRASDSARPRSMQPDKWVPEREWGDRPSTDKGQSSSWNTNRRTWVGGDEENLPEWAMENAETGGGTFDSSGAFHGYSNDDTNLPKSQEPPFALARSHTHGSFVRSKTVEEGSDEWWASEKAKKLSPKRFEKYDALEIKFKTTTPTDGSGASSSATKPPSKDEPPSKPQETQESLTAHTRVQVEDAASREDKNKVRFTERKTFEALMRQDINLPEENDDRRNIQSVMINPNNSLRQKHQNMVPQNMSTSDNRQRQNPNRKPNSLAMQMLKINSQKLAESDQQQQYPESKIVNDIIGMNLEDRDLKDMLSSLPQPSDKLLNPQSSRISSVVTSRSQHNMSSTVTNPGLVASKGNIGLPNSGLQSHSQPLGITNSALNASLGLPIGPSNDVVKRQLGIPLQGVPSPVLPGHGSNQTMGPGLQKSKGPNLASQNMGMLGQSLGLGSSLSSQNLGPSITGQNLGPHLSGQNMGSSLSSQNMGASSSGHFMGPGMTGQTMPMGPNMSGQGIGPNMSSQGMDSNLSSQGMSSNMSSQGMGPNITGQNMGANMSGPNMFGQNMALNLSAHNMGPNMSGQNTASKLSGHNQTMPGMMQSNSGMSGYPPGSMAGRSSANHASSLFHGQPSSNNQNPPSGDIPMPGSQPNMYQMIKPPLASGSLYGNMLHQPPPPLAPTADSWYYEDPTQNVQGPFTSRDMYTWYLAGFFTPSLMVRRATDPVMKPLGSYTAIPFSPMVVDPLWSQPTSQPDLLWMQWEMNRQKQSSYYWNNEPSPMAPKSLCPEIPKEIKTEDEILAQLRASQANSVSQNLGFLNNPPLASLPSNLAAPPGESFQQSNVNFVPDLDKLQKLMQEKPPMFTPKEFKIQHTEEEPQKIQQPVQKQEVIESKGSKQVKPEPEKAKTKETTPSKVKGNKKSKEDAADSKPIEDDANAKTEKKDSSPSKTKKEEKINKKEAEKERKEWINEGFTIVKAQDKAISKENKKKQEELKLVEEIERKRKDEERLAVEEENKMKNLENLKKDPQKRQQQSESVSRKAPWSAVTNQQAQESSKDGLTLAEIQRLEREKKLTQMKEQQQMMHLIAQQQAAALAREQEVQAGLGWNKKKTSMNVNIPGQSLAEIQVEARKQAAAAAVEASVAAASARAQAEAQTAQAPVAQTPWVNTMNGAPGFWESLAGPAEPPAAPEPKPKKKAQVTIPKKEQVILPVKKEQATLPVKKEASPSADFETWCMTVLTSWSTKIDVPTFVGFLKDIESPYEVKDYVKCYLGESRDASDFARQFLERRSKLLRVKMVTPSDDLCSPALAVNPRTNSGSDYQEVKGKAKKSKKNKMLKVDARILGFSVTAAEDRINVGDIDMA